VPADQAAGLTDALRHLRELSSGERGTTLDRLAEELSASGSLTAPRELLAELLAVAIDEAGERLSRSCTELLRGEGTAVQVRAGVTALAGLLDLLERLPEEAQPR
jgi:hypothetical protein